MFRILLSGQASTPAKCFSYEERLCNCGILSIEIRRLRLDLILPFKIMKDFMKIEADDFFKFLKDPHTRGYNLQIIRQTCRLNINEIYL